MYISVKGSREIFDFFGQIIYARFSISSFLKPTFTNRDSNFENATEIENNRSNLANLIALLELMTSDHFKAYVDHFDPGEGVNRIILMRSLVMTFDLMKNLVEHPCFPQDWNIIIMLRNSIIMKTMKEFSSAVITYFTKDSDFVDQVWTSFLKCAVAFVDQPSLQLENFMESKKLKILDMYGDMRVTMAKKINKMWFNLRDNKITFIPYFVNDFLKIALIDQIDVQEAIIPIFLDMILVENKVNGNFQTFQDEFITKLDHLIGEDDLGDANFLIRSL